nr:zinc finger, CCHC-type, retrotransposon Gag domain protein [Tanacetum cinerariifolium]
WLITVTWADFKKLFFLQFFPRAEQERMKREYHSIRQTNTKTSTEFMQHFLRLAGFLGAAVDRRSGGDNHRSNNNYYGSNNRNFGYGRDQRNRGRQSNRSTNSGASGRVFAITEGHAANTS